MNALTRIANVVRCGLVALTSVYSFPLCSYLQTARDWPDSASALEDRLRRLETDAMAILERVGLLNTESFLLRTEYETDVSLGSVIYRISSTCLFSDKDEADAAVWRRFTHDIRPAQGHSVREAQTLGAGSALDSPVGIIANVPGHGRPVRKVPHLHVRFQGLATQAHVGHVGPSPCSGRQHCVRVNSNDASAEQAHPFHRDKLDPAARRRTLSSKRAALMQLWYRIYAEETSLRMISPLAMVLPPIWRC